MSQDPTGALAKIYIINFVDGQANLSVEDLMKLLAMSSSNKKPELQQVEEVLVMPQRRWSELRCRANNSRAKSTVVNE